MEAYPDDVKVVYKPFIIHPDVAVVPAAASCAAHNQGKFAEMEKLIWEKGFAERDLGPEKMTALATELGLDMQKFDADMKGEACQKWIQDSQESLRKVGVNGTPAFYVNGRFLGGAQPLAAPKTLVDEELKKADAAIAAGTPQADYYQKAVVERGKKSLQ